MQLLSVNVGKCRQVLWQGETVNTGIFKQAVQTRCMVRFSGIDGDEQADLLNHGGFDKAVYSYEFAYYEHWKQYLNRQDWDAGLFGENLSTLGLPDDRVFAGDVYQIGSAKLQAVQPRIPCFKLNLRFNLPDMVAHFYQHKRHGIYFRVLEEGSVAAGDDIILLERPQNQISIGHLAACFVNKGQDKEMLYQILQLPALPDRLRKVFIRFSES